jgi:hypothetical protein
MKEGGRERRADKLILGTLVLLLLGTSSGENVLVGEEPCERRLYDRLSFCYLLLRYEF